MRLGLCGMRWQSVAATPHSIWPRRALDALPRFVRHSRRVRRAHQIAHHVPAPGLDAISSGESPRNPRADARGGLARPLCIPDPLLLKGPLVLAEEKAVGGPKPAEAVGKAFLECLEGVAT